MKRQTLVSVIQIVLLALISMMALAGDHRHATTPAISVSATGVVNAEPDIAIVTGRVSAQNILSEKAVNEARQKLDAVIRFARKSGIDKDKLQAAQVEVHPQWHHSRDKPRELVGFQAHANFTLTLEDLGELSSIYAGLAAVGISDLSPAMFDFSKRQKLELEAIAIAVENARNKALAALEPLGQEPGDAIDVVVHGPLQPQLMGRAAAMNMRMLTAESAPMAQTNVGHHQISATVNVNFAIED